MDEATAIARRARSDDEVVRPRAEITRPAAQIAADRHSRRVRIFKIVLPALGVAALLLVGGLTWFKMHFASGIDVRNVLFSKDGLTMVEPRLTGRSQDRSYDVTATRAFQNITDPKIVRMEGIDGRVSLDDGSSVKLESPNGTYDGNQETLRLEGGLTLSSSKGWRVEGSTADVALTDGSVVGQNGVRINGPGVLITADRIDLTDNGHRVLFTGNVHLTIVPGETGSTTDTTP